MAGLTIGQWLGGATNGSGNRWYGLEMDSKDTANVLNTLRSRIKRSPIMNENHMKEGRVHTDLYLSAEEFDILNNIIDKYLEHKNAKIEE